ncbi:hypothetical protein Neosp_011094 [[Neocosmospora] mangrovei]
MATQTITVTEQTKVFIEPAKVTTPRLWMKLENGDPEGVPEWMRKLHDNGWTIINETISKEKALAYADKGHEWLESWNLGYKRDDPSSRKETKVPWHIRGGLYARYGVAHEQFVWDLRTEESLVDKFAQIWGTDELLVSYDGVNLSVPDQAREKSDSVFAPWSHVDQSPLRTNLQCIQGIMNLLPNGPEDGGLMVLENSNKFYAELWEHFDHKKGPNGWNKWEQQFVDKDMCDWLETKGCKWVKVCAQPGDLILWDSRCIHYGATPSSTNDRFAAYVCFKPAAFVSEETKQKRLEVFQKKQGTAHDPAILRVTPRLPPDDHPSYADAVSRPLQEPVLSKRAKQLAGLLPY